MEDISPESTQRRKISIQIWPTAEKTQQQQQANKSNKNLPLTDVVLHNEMEQEVGGGEEEEKANEKEKGESPVRKREVNAVMIGDYVAWKRGLPVYPLPIPGVF